MIKRHLFPVFEGKRLKLSSLIFAFCLTTVLASHRATSAATDSRLVGHYPLNGTAEDISGNNLHGVMHGPTGALDRFGSASGALSFNGGSYIDCGNPAGFNFASNFTLTAWIKINSPHPNRYIIAKYAYSGSSGSPNSYGLATEESFRGYGFVSGSGPIYTETRGGPNLNDTNWHALALVYDRTFGIRLFVDGELASSNSAPDLPSFNNAVPLTIGSLTPGYYFDGLIDDVRIYNDALGSEEITSLYDYVTKEIEIIDHPDSTNIATGTNATFTVVVGGTASSTARYQWFEDGTVILGATNSSYTTPIQEAPGTKAFTVTIHGGAAVLTSLPATLTIYRQGPTAPLAHWTFDEEFGTNIIDQSGSYPGIVQNGIRISGRIGGGALHLSGNDSYMLVGGLNSPLLLTNTPYTISWWQKWDGPSSTHQNVFAMDDGADYSGGYSSYIFQSSANLGYVHDDGLIHEAWFNVTQADYAWRYYAVTYDGNNLRFYQDGVLHSTGPTRGPLVTDGDDPLVIGAIRLQDGNFANFFRGAFDDFRIYGRSLSDSEIALLGPTPEIQITRQPSNYNVGTGEVVTLSIDATVIATNAVLSYQWLSNGVAIPDATTAALTVTGAVGQARSYRVQLQAGHLAALSDEAIVNTVSASDGKLLLHLEFESAVDGEFLDSASDLSGIEGTVSLAPGRVGNFGVALNGTGYLRVPSAGTELELVGTSYTITWWHKPVSQPNAPQIFTMGELGGDTGYGARLWGQFNSQVRTEHRNGLDLGLAAPLRTGLNWVHMAVVYNGLRRTFYTNGVVASSVATTRGIFGNGRDDLFLGASSTNQFYSAGVVDDFRIYSYPLASDEILALVNVPSPLSRLLIAQLDGSLIIRWPNADTNQYRVEYTAALGPEATWTPLSAPIESIGLTYQVTERPINQLRFYRLRKL